MRRERSGAYALVVGASATVGEQFARQLAAEGRNVLLVARRAFLLEKIAAEIRAMHGVAAEPIALDLLAEGGIDALLERTRDYEVDLLVCNANLHRVGTFHETDLETRLNMVQMNVTLPLLLSEHFGSRMIERRRGGIIFVNALNCLSPLYFDAVFQGTKAFLLLFGESLAAEYERNGVRVGVALLGGIEGSESFEEKVSARKRRMVKAVGGSMAPERMVREILKQHAQGEPVIVPDFSIPTNLVVHHTGLVIRLTRSRRLNQFWSGLFGWWLDR